MATIEEISMSLVREFLNRKGLKSTLHNMDVECPRTPNSINSRSVLCKTLHIERLVHKNKEVATPFKTIIEIIVGYFIDKGKKSHEVASGNAIQETESSLATNVKCLSNIMANQTSLADGKTIHVTAVTQDSQPEASLKLGSAYDKLLEGDAEKSLVGSNLLPAHQNPHHSSLVSSDASHDTTATSTTTSTSSRVALPLSSAQRSSRHKQVMVSRTAQPVIGSSYGSSKGKKTKALRLSHKLKEKIEEDKVEDLTNQQSLVAPVLSLATTKPATIAGVTKAMHESSDKVISTTHLRKEDKKIHIRFGKTIQSAYELPKYYQQQFERYAKSRDNAMELSLEDVSDSDIHHLSIPNTGGFIRSSQQAMGDGKVVSKETTKQLRKLLFGSSKGYFNAEWVGQNFVFATTPGLEYGLVQHKGGPCGVLASVQAYVLKHLLFTAGSGVVASVKDRINALSNAMTDILCKVKSSIESSVILALPSLHSSSLTADVIDQLVLYEKSNKDDVMDFLQHNLNIFTGPGQPGCILLLISTILTRGIQNIVDDMDEPTSKLIGRHNYCTQDLVNLFLVGRAVSNTHNGIITLGTGNESIQLKGLHCQSEIGFLSLFEHYKSCTVGSYYKQPKYPLWVVCSESHFSILFATNRDFFVRNPSHFDLIYYNGLGEQDQEIRLTIDTTHKIQKEDDDLVSPLDLCIRTCWSEAHVDWNGISPLL